MPQRHSRRWNLCLTALCLWSGGLLTDPIFGQARGLPDRGQPGDEMIQAYLARESAALHARFADDLKSHADWTANLPRYRQEYLHMLGLSPLPERTPLQATVTGTLQQPGYVVEKLHYQSRPGLYVTGNLYRPEKIAEGEKLPAVFYVCGHSNVGRNGNKAAYQSHGIWLAKHGYICLVVDTLQLGEIAAIHHGTYREQRWWWHSRGYTSAGIECWNGIRGIDYLISRPDVDAERIAVTGISGGGAATFWIAAADERVKVAVPVSGMSDLPAYVTNRVINGHCDCMFCYNTYQWPWVRIAALIAPRPMLFVNSDADPIFPMDGNERISAQLERLYSLSGTSDRFDTVVSVGGHAYREDLRQAIFRFLNTHLKYDPRPVTDSEQDLVVAEYGTDKLYPIPPEELRVFPTDADLPRDELNTKIDQVFVRLAEVKAPEKGGYDAWRKDLVSQLRELTFRPFPEQIPAARRIPDRPGSSSSLETEPGIVVPIGRESPFMAQTTPIRRVLLVVQGDQPGLGWLSTSRKEGDRVHTLQPRGFGRTAWTRTNPPNYVERSHVLLGRTVAAGRVYDIIATVRFLRAEYGPDLPLVVAGMGDEGLLAAYAAVLEPGISGVIAHTPPATHQSDDAPALLNVLRVCDVPQVLGMIAPRSLKLISKDDPLSTTVRGIYQAADAEAQFTVTAPVAP